VSEPDRATLHTDPRFRIPEGYTYTNTATCRSCAAPVAWAMTPTGRRMPLDPDGKSHFATCPQADAWRSR